MVENSEQLEKKNKALSLYKYLSEYNALDNRMPQDIGSYGWKLFLDNIPDDKENIAISYKDRIKEDDEETNDNRYSLVSVKKPMFEKCPIPPVQIKDWLLDGWDNYRIEPSIKTPEEMRPKISDEPVEEIEESEAQKDKEKFEDSEKRVQLYKNWLEKRKIWQARQFKIKKTRDFFNNLYQIYVDLNEDSDTRELVVANGFINYADDKSINHPILVQRVYMDFNSYKNIISIYDNNSDPELYVTLLTSIPDVNTAAINEAKEAVKQHLYHPLDRNETYDFFKNFIHKLSSKSKFLNKDEQIPQNTDDKIFLSINPVYYVRKKVDGARRVIEDIISDIEHNGKIPSHICELISGGKVEIPDDNKVLTIDEQLAETSGESSEILLSKAANREQLEIAKRVEKYNAVLVQGPPGTGKTHTIANLLGHFLSQGKNVLVTSYSSKALKVLKDKVAEELKPLCVSVLDDKNTDVEKSINGINEYLSKENSSHLKKKIQETELERKITIENLAKIRRKIFSIRNSEYKQIIYDGKSYSPSEIATFINEKSSKLSYIPGKIAKNILLPLTKGELLTLYESNTELSEFEEKELTFDIINPADILSPQDFNKNIDVINDGKKRIEEIVTFLKSEKFDNLIIDDLNIKIKKSGGNSVTLISNPDMSVIDELQKFLSDFNIYDEWMVYAAVDGNKGGGYKKCWTDLIDNIKETVQFSDSFVNDRFGKTITFSSDIDFDETLAVLEKIQAKLLLKGKLSFLDKIFNTSLKEIKEKIKINDKVLSNSKDCELIINTIKLQNMRSSISNKWDNLIGNHNYKKFFELDEQEPEQIANNIVPKIIKYLDWNNNEFSQLNVYLSQLGFNLNEILQREYLDSDIEYTKKIFNFTTKILPKFIDLIKTCNDVKVAQDCLYNAKNNIIANNRKNSELCNDLFYAVEEQNKNNYLYSYNEITQLYNKIKLKQQREKLIERLKQYAPDWAYAIQHRQGIYGDNKIPVDIVEAWKYKQFQNIIEELHSDNYDKLQKDCYLMEKNLKKQTAQLCEYKAWFHLLRMTEGDLTMKQALTGWKSMIKKIGKGTGKNVPRYIHEAKKDMSICQKAVPAWIMPMSKAFETLTPGKNYFDVIIIDEASQADITALALVYMAKKIIIVCDDKQVSPNAGFRDRSKVNNLIDVHIKGIIPNEQLYEAGTSLYELADTTFPSLMLKEHFRCVPDIINFSNGLSYDYKIKPLRDASSSSLQPAFLNISVPGMREPSRKINKTEAYYIASLVSACIEQEEYKNASIGIISLLGTEQAKYIKNILLDKIDNIDYDRHKIACGEPPNFQGDERDVIFLSMVDSNDSDNPLNMMSADGDRKRRYNVAVSRAKDQVWLIHSLDITKDLKEGDIRRKLIEYSMNPSSFSQKLKQVEELSDSDFEKEVCKSLLAKGYNVIQQFPVSTYKIDMVICYKNKKVALECDGDKYHYGEEKIRADMERQNIIERITKFHFIRIRSSEYNLDKDKAIDRIINELNAYDIYPEENHNSNNSIQQDPELIENIKIRAQQIRENWKREEQEKQKIENINIQKETKPIQNSDNSDSFQISLFQGLDY